MRTMVILLLVILATPVYSLEICSMSNWAATYGGTNDEEATSILQTPDGGYIVAGYTDSFGSGGDIWILKLNEDGGVEWQKAYGGSSWDVANYIQQTSDGGYIVAGIT